MTTAEPGRSIADDGRVVYAWPPEGRFAALWERVEAALPGDDERLEALSLLARWGDETSTIVAFTDDDGEWVDVEWPWDGAS